MSTMPGLRCAGRPLRPRLQLLGSTRTAPTASNCPRSRKTSVRALHRLPIAGTPSRSCRPYLLPFRHRATISPARLRRGKGRARWLRAGDLMAETAFAGIGACVFDAYGTVFDFAAAAAGCRDVLGGDAERLTALWRD